MQSASRRAQGHAATVQAAGRLRNGRSGLSGEQQFREIRHREDGRTEEGIVGNHYR